MSYLRGMMRDFAVMMTVVAGILLFFCGLAIVLSRQWEKRDWVFTRRLAWVCGLYLGARLGLAIFLGPFPGGQVVYGFVSLLVLVGLIIWFTHPYILVWRSTRQKRFAKGTEDDPEWPRVAKRWFRDHRP